MRRPFFLLLAFFSCLPFGKSQSVQFEHLTQENGFSGNTNAMLKDKYGFMWFGSFGGLKRYDGYNIVSYNHNPKDYTTIADDYVRCLLETKDSLLYIGHPFNGFCIYNREQETFTRFRKDPKNPNSLSHDYVLCIYQDRSGKIWIGTRAGLDLFDYHTKKFKHYNPFNNGSEKSFVTSITEDKEGNLWLCGQSNKVCKFNYTTGTSEFYQFTEKHIENIFVHGGIIQIDSRQNLWIGHDEAGLIRWDLKSGKKENYNNQLASVMVYSIIEDAEGYIWVGTDGGGLYKYDYASNHLTPYQHISDDPGSLNSNAIYCIYESEPGIIWAGTFSSGLNVLKKYKRKFKSFSNIGEEEQRLSHKSVLAIQESEDGKIWLGTDGGGLNVYDPQRRSFKVFKEENSSICGNVIKSLEIDKEKKIWAGTYAKGLCRIDPSTWQTQNYRSSKSGSQNSLSADHIWALHEGSDNKLWIGLIGGAGLCLFDKTTGSFSSFVFDSTELKKYVNSNVFVVFEDRKKRVWIGTEASGVICYDKATNTIHKFAHDESNPRSISNNSIRDVYEDSGGTIWITTIKGGLNKLVDFTKKEFVHYKMQNGLPTNETQDILEDIHGNLWISTTNGLSLFKVHQNTFVNFDKEDGLAGKEFNNQSALCSKDGHLYFVGIDGLTMFHPDSVLYNTTPPKVYINDFKIFNRSVNLDKNYFSKSVYLSDEVHLGPDDIVFTISFTAISYLTPVKNKFAYKLEGFDKEFTYVNSEYRTATYTNLDPGEYVFKVLASNNDGVWNTTGASIRIVVHPPWFVTAWFKVLLLVGAGMVVAGFYRIRLHSIKRQNALLEQEVEARTLSLKEKQTELEKLNRTKDRFFSIIAHDLKNPVTALHLLTDFLQKEFKDKGTPGQQELLDHVHKSSVRIKDLVLNLLEWAKTQSVSVKVEKKDILLINVFRDEIQLHHEHARQKNISLTAEVAEGCYVTGDENMIRTIVRNILNNGIKFTSKGGSVKISAAVNAGKVIISIQDTGVGIPEEIKRNLFEMNNTWSTAGTENETGTGLGMLICHEFAKLNDGKIYVESEVGKGSTFYVEIPGGIKS